MFPSQICKVAVSYSDLSICQIVLSNIFSLVFGKTLVSADDSFRFLTV